ncbi:OB-fold nucleic acid binding domain-containing protein [Candidatus Bathyarchaeota archaeon]|jgi:replication factor A1|nr:OB-fold nucleic acid binding domain-containing protein [Candidatus Bathyarchaeota archaeon]
MPVAVRTLGSRRGPDRDFVYLLMLARKYGLEPTALHNAMLRAKTRKEATCGPLEIELRDRGDKTFCFMFSQNERSVAQASVSDASLARLTNVPQEFKRLLNSKHGPITADDQAETERRIRDLQIGLKHVSLKAKVTAKSEVRAVESRNGSPLVVCVATLSDGTGEIRLPLWNKQIDSVKKNDMVMIRDAAVKNFRGEMQLSLPWKTGTISAVHSTD